MYWENFVNTLCYKLWLSSELNNMQGGAYGITFNLFENISTSEYWQLFVGKSVI